MITYLVKNLVLKTITKIPLKCLSYLSIVVMVFIQIQSVTEEKKRLKADLDEAYKRHKEELEIQQLQHFQVNIGGEGENWLKKGKEG